MWRKRYKPKSGDDAEDSADRLSLEKGDLPALLIAALITLLPAVAVVGGIFTLAIWLFFLR